MQPYWQEWVREESSGHATIPRTSNYRRGRKAYIGTKKSLSFRVRLLIVDHVSIRFGNISRNNSNINMYEHDVCFLLFSAAGERPINRAEGINISIGFLFNACLCEFLIKRLCEYCHRDKCAGINRNYRLSAIVRLKLESVNSRSGRREKNWINLSKNCLVAL